MERYFRVYGYPVTVIGIWLIQMFMAAPGYADENHQRVQVVDPYIELHTGPGRGFPVFHVAERGEWLQLLMRRTDWFKVRSARGTEGWVNRMQLENTLTEAGVKQTFRDVLMDDYFRRHIEFGMAAGAMESDPLLRFHVGYRFNNTLSAEVAYMQVQGVFAGSTLYQINLQSQPYPEWRLAPFFSIGAGRFNNIPKTTLVNAMTTDSVTANAGFGLRYYITRRFMARADYANYVLFVSDERTDSYTVLTAGLAFFF